MKKPATVILRRSGCLQRGMPMTEAEEQKDKESREERSIHII